MVHFEKDNPNSDVHTLGDAVWYMLVSLTSVGYGDKVPVSLGVLGVLISSISSNIFTMIKENKIYSTFK